MAELFVITGPSGVGKGTILARLRPRFSELAFPISATTRKPRPGEQDGVDYFFYDEQTFTAMIEADAFVEHAVYGDCRYGTLIDELRRPQEDGRAALLEIELQGARMIRARFPNAVMIFIAPPDAETLAARLAGRGTEDAAQIAGRLKTARVEMSAANEFDYVIVNDAVERAAELLGDLISRRLGPVSTSYPPYVVSPEQRERWDYARGIAEGIFDDEANIWQATRSIYQGPTPTRTPDDLMSSGS